jgi:cytoskeletal protein RodZ
MLMLKMPANSGVPKRRLLIIVGMVGLLAIAGVCLYWLKQNPPAAHTTTEQSQQQPENKTPTSEPTKPAQSEGSNFPVPQTTPDNSVKNYTLVTENEEYKIRRDQNGDYLITLYPIVSSSSQYGTYNDQLKTYKQHALDYLKNQNVDVTKVKITYEPAEAANL